MDGNQIEGAGQAAPPVVNQDELKNQLAEERRKREQMEAELSLIREQEMRRMATPQPQYNYNPAPEPLVEDEDIQALDPAYKKAIEKMIAREKSTLSKTIEDTSRKTYYKEQIKIQAMGMYPDLRNPSSEFFKKVAFFMDTHPEKYNDPEGILDACARVRSDMGSFNQPVNRASETMRQQVSSGSAAIEGSGNAPVNNTYEMDVKGVQLANKLGIDAKKMAERLKDLQEGKGVYAPKEGKTGKASL